MKFIKLTKGEKSVWVNVSLLSDFEETEKGTGITMALGEIYDYTFIVKETPQQILSLIDTPQQILNQM